MLDKSENKISIPEILLIIFISLFFITGAFMFIGKYGSITGFAVYVHGSSANLTIYDDTNDAQAENKDHYIDEQVKFYAEYINNTNNAINGTNISCIVKFNLSAASAWQNETNMTFNSSSSLYEYNRTFDVNGSFKFNVMCNASHLGYDILNLTDSFMVYSSPIVVNNSAPSPIKGSAYYTTIQEAINISNVGNRTYVASGNYSGFIINQSIVVVAGDNATINSSINIQANYATLKEFNILPNSSSRAVVINANYTKVLNNMIITSNAEAIFLNATTHNNTVDNNNITTTGSSAYGIFLNHTNDNNVTNNRIDSNTYALYIVNSSRNIFQNNLLGNVNNTFQYLGDVMITDFENTAPDPTDYDSLGKCVNITNTTYAWVYLNISYYDVDTNYVITGITNYAWYGAEWTEYLLTPITTIDIINSVVSINISSLNLYSIFCLFWRNVEETITPPGGSSKVSAPAAVIPSALGGPAEGEAGGLTQEELRERIEVVDFRYEQIKPMVKFEKFDKLNEKLPIKFEERPEMLINLIIKNIGNVTLENLSIDFGDNITQPNPLIIYKYLQLDTKSGISISTSNVDQIPLSSEKIADTIIPKLKPGETVELEVHVRFGLMVEDKIIKVNFKAFGKTYESRDILVKANPPVFGFGAEKNNESDDVDVYVIISNSNLNKSKYYINLEIIREAKPGYERDLGLKGMYYAIKNGPSTEYYDYLGPYMLGSNRSTLLTQKFIFDKVLPGSYIFNAVLYRDNKPVAMINDDINISRG